MSAVTTTTRPRMARARDAARDAVRDPLRVLVITRLFPNAVEPLSAPFNRQQFAALGRRCHVEIMATIPWFPGSRMLRRISGAASPSVDLRDVPPRDVVDGLAVAHPRVLYVPRIGAGLSAALEAGCLLRDVMARRRDVDVILGSWAYPDGAAAVALSMAIGVPAVIKVHGSDLNVLSSMRGPRANLALAMPRAARIVAVSRALAEKVSSFGVEPGRIAVIPNGVDASLFHVRDARLARRALGWPAGGRIVLYCGRVERAKGVLELIEAFKAVLREQPDLSLVILGDGSARAEAEARARPIEDSVRFLGARSLAEVPMWMAASSLVTLPSHNEGSPNVVREALACGRPVVATSVGGIPELVHSPNFGELVPPRDPGALARALLRVVGRSSDAEAIAASCGGSWDDSAAALLSVLKAAQQEPT